MRRIAGFSLVALMSLAARIHGQLAQGDTVTVVSGALQLKALLWRPESKVPVPAVLFHHGGGCADIPQAAQQLGSRFLTRGYALLWLYRRGAGASRGQGECAFQQIARARTERGDTAALELQFRLMTTTELDDALAGVSVLRSLPGIDPRRIVVAGHSFGGQLAILSAERDSSLRAALSFAGGAAVWSRSARIRERLAEAVRRMTVPLYLGYAADDNAEPGKALGSELERSGKVHQLAIYPSGGHNFLFNPSHPADADVFRFLSTYVRP